MPTCEYNDGKRCRRQGSGTPAICAQHRAAMQAFMDHRSQGDSIGSRIGSLLEQMISGQRPTKAQLDEVAAAVAGRMSGRPVTPAEVREFRVKLARGESPWPSGSPPGPSPDGAAQAAWERAQAWYRQRTPGPDGPPPPPTPEEHAAAREAYEKKQRLRAITEARKTLGFGPKEPVTKQMLKERFRELAKKWHPDRPGGSVERMQAINVAVEVLTGSM